VHGAMGSKAFFMHRLFRPEERELSSSQRLFPESENSRVSLFWSPNPRITKVVNGRFADVNRPKRVPALHVMNLDAT
jgi:hypothetical protein